MNLSLGVDLSDSHNRVDIDRLLVTETRVLLQPTVLLQCRILYLLHVSQLNVVVLLILKYTTSTITRLWQERNNKVRCQTSKPVGNHTNAFTEACVYTQMDRQPENKAVIDCRLRPWCCHMESFRVTIYAVGGSVAEWLACWAQAQKGLGPNHSRDTDR